MLAATPSSFPRLCAPRSMFAMHDASRVVLPTVDPRDVVSAFDARYDQKLEHHLAIALLEICRAFDSTDLSIRVGASWCRIIRADVEYRLADGLAEVEGTREDAARLHEQVTGAQVKRDGVVAGEQRFARYACARWYDGAAKISFRCGDYAEAIVRFDRAFELVEGVESLWHCQEDIASNCLRTRYDVLDAAMLREVDQSAHDEVKRRQGALIAELRDRLRLARRPGDPEPGGDGSVDPGEYAAALAARAGTLDVEWREHLRGLCSLAHNLSVILAKRDRAEARAWSNCSLRLADALGDPYRRAQAIGQQASSLGRTAEAKALYQQLGKDWRRGEEIAQQNIAWIDNDPEVLKRMLEEKLAHRNATAGLDYRLLQFAARRLHDCKDENDQAYDDHPYMLRSVRAVRRVVKLAHYKRLFAAQMRPIFLEEARRRLDRARRPPVAEGKPEEDPFEPLVAVVEESSARELLDLLGSTVSEQPPRRALLQDDESRSPPVAPPLAEGPRRRGQTTRVRALDEPRNEIINQQRHAWEEYMTGRPIPVREHDADVGRALRAMTAQRTTASSEGSTRSTCIVRYFEHGDPAEPDLGALVYAEGRRPRLVEWLDVTAIRALAVSLPKQPAPDRESAEAMWELAVGPLGDVCGVDHLVIIPAGPLFQFLLYIAYDGDALLGAKVPLSFSVSATAYLTGRRHLLRWQPIDRDDDLCALIPHYTADEPLSADDVDVAWPRDNFYIAGARPHGLERSRFKYVGDGDLDGLRRLASVHPEIFVYVGHGGTDSEGEPLLRLEGGMPVTPYALLTPYTLRGENAQEASSRSARLSRNKWTILSACVSGQQADLAGGEVAGFVRALTAAGAGALVLALWRVLSSSAAETTRALLSRALEAREGQGVVDVVGELQRHYAARRSSARTVGAWIERCPFAVYL